jgi:hypothetical protein
VIIKAANGTTSGSGTNTTFIGQTENALQGLISYVESAGIQLGNILGGLGL